LSIWISFVWKFYFFWFSKFGNFTFFYIFRNVYIFFLHINVEISIFYFWFFHKFNFLKVVCILGPLLCSSRASWPKWSFWRSKSVSWLFRPRSSATTYASGTTSRISAIFSGKKTAEFAEIWFLTKISVSRQNLDFWPEFPFFVKILIFEQNFGFSSKPWFFTRISIFRQNFNFWTKFRFLVKTLIFDQNFHFSSKF